MKSALKMHGWRWWSCGNIVFCNRVCGWFNGVVVHPVTIVVSVGIESVTIGATCVFVKWLMIYTFLWIIHLGFYLFLIFRIITEKTTVKIILLSCWDYSLHIICRLYSMLTNWLITTEKVSLDFWRKKKIRIEILKQHL